MGYGVENFFVFCFDSQQDGGTGEGEEGGGSSAVRERKSEKAGAIIFRLS
jgi:hypothetical protein